MTKEILNTDISEEVKTFFHHFALNILTEKGVNINDKRAVKETMVEFYETIYPAFSKTNVFERCFEKPQHEEMVEEYKKNFCLLLEGKLP